MPRNPKQTANAPPNLGASGQAFFDAMSAEYDIDPAGLELLMRAAEALDRLREAQAAIAEHGTVYRHDGALKMNPATKLEKEAVDRFLSAMRLLRLGKEKIKQGRPPGPAHRKGIEKWAEIIQGDLTAR